MTIKFIIFENPAAQPGYTEDFKYLTDAFPGSEGESYTPQANKTPLKRFLGSFTEMNKKEDADFYVFLPHDSIHIPPLLLEKMITSMKDKGTNALIYEETVSYPLYNFYGYKDRCAVCSKAYLAEKSVDEIVNELIASESPDGFIPFRADMDIFYATYNRYLDTDIKPLSFVIESTNACNFKCRMCFYHGESHKDKPTYIKEEDFKELPLAAYEKIVDQIHELGYKMITLVPQGRGEPLAHPNFIEVIKTLHKYPENYVTFSTNGSLLTEEISRQLIEENLFEIVISFHSTNKETYEKLGIGADFERVQANLETLLKLKKEMNSESPRVVLKFVEMPENRNEFYDFLQKWLIDRDDIYSIGIAKENSYEFGENDTMSYSELFDFPGMYTNNRCPCNTALWSVPIYSDGSVFACISNYKKDLKLGNINETPLKDIIYGEKRREFLRKCNDLEDIDEHCKGCQGWVNHTRMKGALHGLRLEGGLQMPFFYKDK